MIGFAMTVVLAQAPGPIELPLVDQSAAKPKVVVGMLLDGTVLRGARRADERRLRADLDRLQAGDEVVLCLQGMNEKVSKSFDRVILSSSGKFDTKFHTKGLCPKDPATQGASSSR